VDAEFLHALIHDLKGPVSRIRILGELLTRQTASLDAESQLLVKHMETSAIAAQSVLEGLRRYADAVGWEFRPQKFDLTLALTAAMARLDARLTSNGATVTYGDLPEICADMGQMATLFEELLANALRFRSPDAPVVEIAVMPAESNFWLICVTDNGIGLSDSDAQRIFRPLAKASDRSGAGMGLTICSRIATLHGGEIRAIPRLRGAEFHLRLPR